MIEKTILSALVNNEEYVRKVIPYVEKEYFSQIGEQITFALIKDHYLKYNKVPSKETVLLDLEGKSLNETIFEKAKETIDSLSTATNSDVEWLTDKTEDWCKQRAFYNAIVSAADLIDKGDTKLYNGALDVVQTALSVSFDNDIGSDYIENAEERFLRYKQKEDQLKVGIYAFDKATKGGFVNESMTIFMAPTGVGKSLFLCNFAANFLMSGKNVLYLTMEMSEFQVEKRIDQNLLDIKTDEIEMLEHQSFVKRIAKIKNSNIGKLIVKGYPSKQAHSGHFRYLIKELFLKRGFKPDVIIVDYLNICSSARVSASVGTYTHDQSISEELRGLAQEFKCRVFTATQTNRGGTKASDFDVTDVSNSWGVPFTADYMYGIIETEELATLSQMKIKRLKDRYNSITGDGSAFIIGVDKDKQRIYDVDDKYSVDDTPVFDSSEFSDDKFSSLIMDF